MSESKSALSAKFEREIASVQSAQRKTSSPSIREIIEKTQDLAFKKILIDLVAPLKASSASGRYPTVAQVRKMLAANDNYDEDARDYSAVSAEYERLFGQYVTSGGDISELLRRMDSDDRLDVPAFAEIAARLTGRSGVRLTKKAAQRALVTEFANRSVSRLGKAAAKLATPF